MPSRKRSLTKKNGTCKHCGHRMKGGSLWSTFFGGPPAPGPTTVPDDPATAASGPKTTSGGKEKTTLFGTWGGKSKKSKNSKNSKSKKSKK